MYCPDTSIKIDLRPEFKIEECFQLILLSKEHCELHHKLAQGKFFFFIEAFDNKTLTIKLIKE
jgi:hypothetical protein